MGVQEMDGDVVDVIVQRVAQCLTEHFDARHDAIERRLAALEGLIESSASDIKHDTKFTRAIASRSFAEMIGSFLEHETPEDDEPTPPEFRRAAAADPSEGDQRVDLDRHGAVVVLRPGVDADRAWGEVKADLRRARGAQ